MEYYYEPFENAQMFPQSLTLKSAAGVQLAVLLSFAVLSFPVLPASQRPHLQPMAATKAATVPSVCGDPAAGAGSGIGQCSGSRQERPWSENAAVPGAGRAFYVVFGHPCSVFSGNGGDAVAVDEWHRKVECPSVLHNHWASVTCADGSVFILFCQRHPLVGR